MNRPIRLLPAFMTVGVWTLASRLLGFVRDIMIAAFLGTGPVAEAFLIAFSLPNMFRRFFAEGAFNMAFVPMFSKKLEAGEDAEGFARDALSGLALIVLLLTLAAQVFMPFLVMALASGFIGDERFDLAVLFGRIAFPYLIFISLAALFSGVLNSLGRFAAAAAAPVLLNIILILAMLAAGRFGFDLGRTLVWGVSLAGVAQLALVWRAAEKAGIILRPARPRLTPELKRLAIIAAPAALAGGVVQINLVVGRQVASFYDGAVAWLSYADRLYQLPLGVVGIAIGVVLLPDLSRRLRAGDTAGGLSAINRATEFTLALTLPAAVALIVVPGTLISVLFQRGAFGAEDVAATAAAVAVYGVGLPAFVLQKILSPVYFAREDTRTPFRYAVVSMIVNAGIAIGFAPHFGFLAAAVGTTVAGWVMVLLLWRGTSRFDGAVRIDTRLRRSMPRIALASVIMGLIVWGTALAMAGPLATPTLRYVALAFLVALGALVYGVTVLAIGGVRRADLTAALRRR